MKYIQIGNIIQNMKVNYSLIGRHIKEIRSAKGLTQADLAEKIDVSTPHISRIESGAKRPSLETLIKTATVLGTTIDVLLLGNQAGDRTTYQGELKDIMKGLSDREQEFILSAIKTMKTGFERMK